MNRMLASLLAGAVLAGVSVAQSAQSQAEASGSQDASVTTGQSGSQAGANASAMASQATNVSDKNSHVSGTSQLKAGDMVQAELVKPVDARKNKVGDEVMAKTTHDVKSNGHLLLPKGSKLVGHVTEAKAQSKGQASSQLGIIFDHAILKNGTEIPLALGIQAIGRGRTNTDAVEDDTMATGSAGAMGSSSASGTGGAGLLGGVRSTAGGAVGTVGSAGGAAVNSAAAGSSTVPGSLSPNSRGIVGLPGLSLSTQTSTSADASVISSEGSNVHLNSGTEMILQVAR